MHIAAYANWDEQKQLRTGTLLIVGFDETIVGNVVMKNPGSARPLESLSLREDGKLMFSVDATMYAIANLFELYKNGGTVRIFNLSDTREADFSKARKNLDCSLGIDVVKEINTFPDIPTYLGWGDLYKDERFSDKARKIFDAARCHNKYLKKNIEDNPFFHPLYLMRYGRNIPECAAVRDSFRNDLIHD